MKNRKDMRWASRAAKRVTRRCDIKIRTVVHSAEALLRPCCLGIAVCMLLTGCGRNKEELEALTAYTEEMSDFCDAIAVYQNEMDSLDVKEENAQEQLFSILDKMTEAAAKAAEAEAPTGYEEAGDLCRNVSDSLCQAEEEYHTAFDSESVDQTALDAANEAYKSAGESIRLVLAALQNTAE